MKRTLYRRSAIEHERQFTRWRDGDRSRLVAIVCFVLSACGGSIPPREPDPADTIRAFQRSIARGDARAAYALLHASARARYDEAQFTAHFRANQRELRSLRLDLADVRARTELRSRDDAVVTLVLDEEEGAWRVSSAGMSSEALHVEPIDAVRALRHAYETRSLRALVRAVAERERQRMNDELVRVLEGTADERTLQIRVEGNRATVLGAQGLVIHLVREAGEWRVESVR